MILSWDTWLEDEGWSGVIKEHNPADRSKAYVRWKKSGVRTEYNLTKSQEAAHQRLLKQNFSIFGAIQGAA